MIDPAEIARLEEARQAAGVADLAPEVEWIAGGSATFAEKGSWANQAQGVAMAGPVTEEELDRLVAFFETRGVEPKVQLCSHADPSLLDGLAARGFVLRRFENVLARDVPDHGDASELLPRGWPEGLELVPVDPGDAESVTRFVRVTTRGFFPDDDPLPEPFLTLGEAVARHPLVDSFLAVLDGEVVGGGAMETRGEVGSLFGTSVLPAARRRGVQAALIARRVVRARERAGRIAVIGSKPGIATERNAMRVGFAIAYANAILVRPGDGLTPSP